MFNTPPNDNPETPPEATGHEVSESDWAAFQAFQESQNAAPAPTPPGAPTVIGGNETGVRDADPPGTVRTALGKLAEPDPNRVGSQSRTVPPDGIILSAEHKAEIAWRFLSEHFKSSEGLLTSIAAQVVEDFKKKNQG